jgi:hypothetical protein
MMSEICAAHRVDLVYPRATGDERAVGLAQLRERDAIVARPFQHRRAAARDEEDDERAFLVSPAQEREGSMRRRQARFVRQRMPAREHLPAF